VPGKEFITQPIV